MGQRLDERSVNGEYRIEKMGESNAVPLRNKTEMRAVAIEAPRSALFNYLQTRLVVPVEKLVGNAPGRILVRQFDRLRAEPLRTDNGNERVGKNAPYGGVWPKVFKLKQWMAPLDPRQVDQFP
jgi:hypothetical protein